MSAQPLEGLRVLDLTQIYQGPYAAFLLASAGADVIKVEPPGGERLRGRGGAHTPLSFVMLNGNKRSITLNLKAPRGREMLLALADGADVLLENYAPGVLDRLELGWEVLHARNPRLVYASGTGYGLSGPDRDQLAMDHTIQAASGVMSMTGDPDRPPARAGGAPSDIMGGVHMYAGIMTALVGRSVTGRGTRVEVSMLEAMLFTLSSEFAAYHAAGTLPVRASGRSPAGACPYGRYRCRDGGWIALICVAESHWRSICEVIGHPELAREGAGFDAAHLRRKREEEVDALIEAWSVALPRDEAFARLRDARVPVAPVRTLDEVQADPHLLARGALQPMHHPEMGDLVLPTSPIRYSEYDRHTLELFPEPGAHNADVYGAELGLGAAELADLSRDGVI